MPRKKTTASSAQIQTCERCHNRLSLNNFYLASSEKMSPDGERVKICKECIKIASLNEDGSLNVDNFKAMMKTINKPFVMAIIKHSIDQVNEAVEKGRGKVDIISTYMKNISLSKKFCGVGFDKSIQLETGIRADNEEEKPKEFTTVTAVSSNGVLNSDESSDEKKPKKRKSVDNFKVYMYEPDNDFEVTSEIVDRFGDGYTRLEYAKMQKKYDKLALNYQLTTNLHEEALATYVRFKIKEENATATGDVASADKWNKAAQDAADKAKLTPKQLTQSDLQGGVSAISEISKAVEESVDIIERLPRFKYAPNDAPDFIIWCYVNFCRKLRGLPEVEYKDVYNFYDKRKEEYIAQYGDVYGIFTDDTSEKNRDSIEKFITLPKDYNDGGDK